MAYHIPFLPDARADDLYWQKEDKKTLRRINKLLQKLQRDGAVQGISKRINQKNRLTSIVENGNIIVLSCRGHYED